MPDLAPSFGQTKHSHFWKTLISARYIGKKLIFGSCWQVMTDDDDNVSSSADDNDDSGWTEDDGEDVLSGNIDDDGNNFGGSLLSR